MWREEFEEKYKKGIFITEADNKIKGVYPGHVGKCNCDKCLIGG